MLHVVSVDVVSFQQAAVAGALHSKLQKHKRKLINQFVLPGMVHAWKWSGSPHQLFQVLLREPRIEIPLLFKLIPRRLCNHGYFLRFESSFWLRWGVAYWSVEGAKEVSIQQADSPITKAQQVHDWTASHSFKWPHDHRLNHMYCCYVADILVHMSVLLPDAVTVHSQKLWS